MVNCSLFQHLLDSHLAGLLYYLCSLGIFHLVVVLGRKLTHRVAISIVNIIVILTLRVSLVLFCIAGLFAKMPNRELQVSVSSGTCARIQLIHFIL